MDNKIFTLIKSEKNNYLLLKMNKKTMFLDEWYVVTGSVEKGESYKEATLREIQEETGLEVIKIDCSEIVFNYHCKEWNEDAHEKVFFVLVKETKPILSEEHTDFLWLNKKDFFEKIYWYGQNKKSLKEIMDKF